jgi:hypothetical protein
MAVLDVGAQEKGAVDVEEDEHGRREAIGPGPPASPTENLFGANP